MCSDVGRLSGSKAVECHPERPSSYPPTPFASTQPPRPQPSRLVPSSLDTVWIRSGHLMARVACIAWLTACSPHRSAATHKELSRCSWHKASCQWHNLYRPAGMGSQRTVGRL